MSMAEKEKKKKWGGDEDRVCKRCIERAMADVMIGQCCGQRRWLVMVRWGRMAWRLEREIYIKRDEDRRGRKKRIKESD